MKMQVNLVKEILINQKNNMEKGIYLLKKDKEKEFISYARLYEEALQKLGSLQSAGIRRGQEILLDFTSFLDFFSLFWACILGDMLPMPADLKFYDEDKINQLLEDSSTMVIITDKKLDQSKLSGSRVLNLRECGGREKLRGAYQKEGNPEDIFMIQFSSGSTSNPKGVMITNRGFMANMEDLRVIRHLTEDETFLGWTPITHNMSLFIMHIYPMLGNHDQYHMSAQDFVKDPIFWLERCACEGVTLSLITNYGVMLFLNALKKYNGELNYDLSKMKHLLSGSDVVSTLYWLDFIKQIKEMKAGDNTCSIGYGLSEATLIVTLDGYEERKSHYCIVRRDSLQLGCEIFRIQEGEDAVWISSVGKPLSHVEVKIVDQKGEILTDSCIGIIKIKGETVMKGYYKRPEMTKRVIDEEGWLDTGDLGFLHEGRLYITGRYKDLILYNGRNYYSIDIQNMIKEELAITNTVCILGVRKNNDINDSVIAFIEGQFAENELEQLKQRVVRHIRSRINVVIEKLVQMDKIPKTASGKFNRMELMKYYEKTAVERSTKEKTKDKGSVLESVTGIFREILLRDVKAEDELSEQGLTSIEITGIYEKLQEKNINLSIGDIFECRTINELAGKLDMN